MNTEHLHVKTVPLAVGWHQLLQCSCSLYLKLSCVSTCILHLCHTLSDGTNIDKQSLVSNKRGRVQSHNYHLMLCSGQSRGGRCKGNLFQLGTFKVTYIVQHWITCLTLRLRWLSPSWIFPSWVVGLLSSIAFFFNKCVDSERNHF